MGRIRTTLIKRTGTDLYNSFPEKFMTDFQHNKNVLGDVAVIHSKKLRNTIAGYITKIAKLNMKKEDKYGQQKRAKTI